MIDGFVSTASGISTIIWNGELSLVEKNFKKRIFRGETEAIVELYDQHGESLLKYLTARVGRANARDVLQNVFTRLFRYHKKLAKANNLTAYIFRMARNEAIRFQQKSENRETANTKRLDDKSLIDQSDNSSRSLENKETVQLLLSLLDAASREIVELKIFSGLTFKEVGQIAGVPEQTASTKYRRAIEKLQQLSRDQFNEDQSGSNQRKSPSSRSHSTTKE